MLFSESAPNLHFPLPTMRPMLVASRHLQADRLIDCKTHQKKNGWRMRAKVLASAWGGGQGFIWHAEQVGPESILNRNRGYGAV